MSFVILLNNPLIQSSLNKDEIYTIDRFLKKAFSPRTEFPLLIFNGVLIGLELNDTVQANIYRIMDLLSTIQSEKQSETYIHWAGGSFNSMWKLTWSETTISIHTEWGEIYPQQLSQVLDANGSYEMNKEEFLSEWKILFNFILKSIDSSGVKIDDSYLPIMKEIEAKIPLFGRYYGHLNKKA